jgi:hypothetical protein
MRSKKFLIMLTVGMLLLIGLSVLVTENSSATTGNTVTSGTVTLMFGPYYSNGYYFEGYHDSVSNNFKYKSSLDGITWGTAQVLSIYDASYGYTAYPSGNYLHFVFGTGYANSPVYYFHGTFNSNGTITVASFSVVCYYTYNWPHITVSSDDHVWISTSSGTAYDWVHRNDNGVASSIWAETSGFPKQPASNPSDVNGVRLIPMSSGMIGVYSLDSRFCTISSSGTVGTAEVIYNVLLSYYVSGISVNGYVYLIYPDSSNNVKVAYRTPAGAWSNYSGTLSHIGTISPTYELCPFLEYSITTHTLYAIWLNYSAKTVCQSANSGTGWSGYNVLYDETADGGFATGARFIDCPSLTQNNELVISYITKTSTPVNLKAGFSPVIVLPTITSTPSTVTWPTAHYYYNMTADQTGGTWAWNNVTSWLTLSGNSLHGTAPGGTLTNLNYAVKVTYTNSNGTAYQNYTLNNAWANKPSGPAPTSGDSYFGHVALYTPSGGNNTVLVDWTGNGPGFLLTPAGTIISDAYVTFFPQRADNVSLHIEIRIYDNTTLIYNMRFLAYVTNGTMDYGYQWFTGAADGYDGIVHHIDLTTQAGHYYYFQVDAVMQNGTGLVPTHSFTGTVTASIPGNSQTNWVKGIFWMLILFAPAWVVNWFFPRYGLVIGLCLMAVLISMANPSFIWVAILTAGISALTVYALDRGN